MVIKFSTDYKEIAQEATVLFKLKKLKEKNDNVHTGFPTLIAFGIFIAKLQIFFFFLQLFGIYVVLDVLLSDFIYH